MRLSLRPVFAHCSAGTLVETTRATATIGGCTVATATIELVDAGPRDHDLLTNERFYAIALTHRLTTAPETTYDEPRSWPFLPPIMKPSYPDSISVGEARDRFFRELHSGNEGGYSEKWFHLKLGRVALPLPNIQSRIDAVRFHDLHHVATGYTTTWTGEAEIAGWELASGCDRFWAAWILNFGAFVVGLWLAPARVFRAFVSGRRSKNLYAETFSDGLLEERLGHLRQRLGLSADTRSSTPADRLAFTLWVVAALFVMALPIVMVSILASA